MVVVDVEYVYPFEWKVVNRFVEENKRQCSIDPKVSVRIETDADTGETHYTYTGKTPLWAKTFLPPMCEWKDTVFINEATQERIERGRNLTQAEKVTMDELTKWTSAIDEVRAE